MSIYMGMNVKENHALLLKMARRMLTHTGDFPTGIDGTSLFCRDTTNTVETCLYRPMVVLVLQGAKRTRIGNEIVVYREGEVMVMGVDLPAASVITEASADRPYISIGIDLDRETLANLAHEAVLPNFEKLGTARGLFVQQEDSDILGAVIRLIKLLDRPERIAVMAPMIMREIHYLLLTGPNGNNLSSFHSMGYKSNQIARAISMLRDRLDKPVNINEIAEELHMASSTFHRHFKKVTNMSPLQYLKKLRLHEAQRMMLSDGIDSGKASMAVGYESVSQFSREYKRLFGEPPRKNILKLQDDL